MNQLWDILNSSQFKQNRFYTEFMDNMSCHSLFSEKTTEWKTAYFISNLSWQEVDFIIESFHERNYNFELDFD